MRFITTLALKNLTRYKRRTFITAIAIALGLMMFIIVDSMLLGVEKESERNLLWYETASIRIQQDDYWQDRHLFPLEMGIEDADSVVTLLQENGYTATGRIQFRADMILSYDEFGEDGNLPVLVTAIDAQKDNTVFHFQDTLIEGRALKVNDPSAMVMGSWLAQDIGAKIGSWVTLLMRGNGGFFEAADFEVVGILNCPNPTVNRSLIMVDLASTSSLLAMEGSVTELDIRLAEHVDVERESAAIQSLLDRAGFSSLTAKSWRAIAGDYLAIADAKRGGTSVILFLVFIIAAVGISNTMLMAMFERTRELGMMRALGMKEGDIRLAFIIEAAGIGLIGALGGILLGALANIYIANVGINLDFLLRDMDIGYRIQSVMRGTWNLKSFFIAFISGIGLSALVSTIPIRRALKMDIPACLRHQ